MYRTRLELAQANGNLNLGKCRQCCSVVTVWCRSSYFFPLASPPPFSPPLLSSAFDEFLLLLRACVHANSPLMLRASAETSRSAA